MNRHLLMGLLIVATAAVGIGTAGADITAIDPADAGPDFAIQGEYVGEPKDPDLEEKVLALQIIALGDGRFRGVPHYGGLPGQEGWNEEGSKEGKPNEFIVVDGKMQSEDMEKEGVTGTFADGVMRLVNEDGNITLVLKKVVRVSPTMGAKPPEGAVVLFDGSSADAFQGGRMTEDGLLMEGVTSKEKFGSFTLHIEFMLPFKPSARGQGRGNSGFYAQGRYEVQVLDSFGLEGKHNECGGIYSIKDPDINMCFPPLSWQTYDVDFTTAAYEDGKKVKNARMTVRHNGVLIHEDVELPRTTTAAPVRENDEPGPIYLQNHGNPVRFRNIWLVPEK